MKYTTKSIFSAAAYASLILFATACTQKELDSTLPEGEPLPDLVANFEPFASDVPSTKLETSPTGHTRWDANDKLTVFVEPDGNAGAMKRYSYLSTEAADGTFKPGTFYGGVPAPGKEPKLPAAKSTYKWYVMSPYYYIMVDKPDGGPESVFTLDGQVQDATSQFLHHLTDYDIMTGISKDIDKSEMPKLTLKHQVTLMKFSIVNNTGAALNLNKLIFETPEKVKIGGRYYVHFENGLEPERATNKAILGIKNCNLAAGQTFEAALIMPPFTLKSGDSFKVTVSAAEQVFSKTYTINGQKNFEKGKMNTATVRVDKVNPKQEATLTQTWNIAGAFGKSLYPITSVAVNDKYVMIMQFGDQSKEMPGGSITRVYDLATKKQHAVKNHAILWMHNDVDNAGHFMTSRLNVWGGGFMSDLWNDSVTDCFSYYNFTAGSTDPVNPAKTGYGFSVCGNMLQGYHYIYGVASMSNKITSIMFRETTNFKPVVYAVPNRTWTTANVQRESVADKSNHYLCYFDGQNSNFEIWDYEFKNCIKTIGFSHYANILDFKVFKLENRTFILTVEETLKQSNGVCNTQLQIIDITDPGKPNIVKTQSVGNIIYHVMGTLDAPVGSASVYVDESTSSANIAVSVMSNSGNHKAAVYKFELK